MKKVILLVAVLSCALAAHALPLLIVEGSQAVYNSGSITGVGTGHLGSLDISAPDALVYKHFGSRITIPYASIVSWKQREEVGLPLGVAARVAVGLIAQRHKFHYIQINFRDPQGTEQFAVFQISSTMPVTLAELLKIRVPAVAKPLPSAAPEAATSANTTAATPLSLIAHADAR